METNSKTFEPQAVGEALAMSVVLHTFRYVTYTVPFLLACRKLGEV